MARPKIIQPEDVPKTAPLDIVGLYLNLTKVADIEFKRRRIASPWGTHLYHIDPQMFNEMGDAYKYTVQVTGPKHISYACEIIEECDKEAHDPLVGHIEISKQYEEKEITIKIDNNQNCTITGHKWEPFDVKKIADFLIYI